MLDEAGSRGVFPCADMYAPRDQHNTQRCIPERRQASNQRGRGTCNHERGAGAGAEETQRAGAEGDVVEGGRRSTSRSRYQGRDDLSDGVDWQGSRVRSRVAARGRTWRVGYKPRPPHGAGGHGPRPARALAVRNARDPPVRTRVGRGRHRRD